MIASPGRVASAVRRELKARRISGRQAAERLGMAQQTFSDRLRGRTAFDAEQVLALAEWLNVPVSVLMEEPGVPRRVDAPPNPRRAPVGHRLADANSSYVQPVAGVGGLVVASVVGASGDGITKGLQALRSIGDAK